MTSYSKWSEAEIKRELARRELARRYYEYYFRYTTEPKGYVMKPFHRVLANKLQSLQEGKIKRLMAFMPPQHGKTTLTTEYFPAWALGRNPDQRLIIGAYSADYAAKLNRAIQRIMIAPQYHRLFPETRLNEKNVATDSHGSFLRNSSVFEIVNHIGSVRTVGRDGGVTGNPADGMIYDDFIKNAEEANSGTLRNKMWEGYQSDFETRMHNNTWVVFTITRWHDDDVAGRLLKRDGETKDGGLWDVVRFEAIKESHYDYDDRQMGEALFPERHGLERLLKIQKDSPMMFEALYQQRPSMKQGNLIKHHYFNKYSLATQLPPGVNHCYIDTATSEADLKNNDPTGILIYRVHDNKIYLIDFIKGMWSMPELIANIKAMHRRYMTDRQSIIWIENKSNGRSTKQILEKETNFSVLLEDPKGKKQERVENELPTMQAGRVYVPNGEIWVNPFIEQCLGFPLMKHDEEVDCLTGAIRTAFKKPHQRRIIGSGDYYK